MKKLLFLITITFVLLLSCNKEEMILASDDLQEIEKDVSSSFYNPDLHTLYDSPTSNNINPFIRVIDKNCKLNLTAIVEPTNPLYSYSWKWSLEESFSDINPGQKLGAGYGSFISVSQPIQQPCKSYFIQMTVKLNGVELATEVIRKKGDLCTNSFQDCDEDNI